ncbi:hypothetical protein [Halobacillus sp. Nhm2S1]|uniref:hypothetical protein n=1 Tax=Halobacillus sp. Nhm2S1 TaxID=2866716 RepID=UPI001C738EEF|nr:hypothetical protein [Halobacillus sp. Nhm2S1]MBX0358405.1 hypothetical protein [Halobacillus sp. Nhm2S1]
MRTDAIIFVSSCFVIFGVITLISLKYSRNKDYVDKKSILIIPNITFAAAIGVVISIMANGSFLESLVVIAVLVVISLGHSLSLIRKRKAFLSYRGKK